MLELEREAAATTTKINSGSTVRDPDYPVCTVFVKGLINISIVYTALHFLL